MTQANHYPNIKSARKKNHLPILDHPILLEALIPSSLHRNVSDEVHRARRKNTICPAAKRFPVIFHFKGRGTCTLSNAKKDAFHLPLWPNLADFSAGNAMQRKTQR